MSLFQAREWWATKPDGTEECDKGCLCVANIDNEPKKNEKIVMGSFSGILRIYYPRQAGYRIDDLILETQLDAPIIQLEAGRFLPGSTRLGLAVLHPRKLVVYNVAAVGGVGAEASYYDLTKAYEHKLERSAFNMTYGSFGTADKKDFICVQSMDGQLYFLEQDNFAFSRYLNNFVIPGPICYVPKIDSFVTVNASMEIECYKYQMLAASHGDKKDDGKDGHGLTTTKKVQVDWSVNLGEHCHDIFVARYSRSLAASQVDILVLGEHTLFTLKENGAIRLQKRLDYNPSACITYNTSDEDPGGSNQNLIISTHQQSLMIYRDMQLVWAARSPHVPVAIRVSSFAGVKGMIVTLSDACHLQVAYLGTDPPMQAVTAAENKELDYEAMDEEHRKLLRIIRQASTDTMAEPKEKLNLRVSVPTLLDNGASDSYGDDDADCARDDANKFIQATITLFVSYTGKEDLENVTLSLSVPSAFKTKTKSLLLPQVKGGVRTPLVEKIKFRVSKSIIPTSMMVECAAAYTTPKGEPRTSKCTIRLPLALACRIVEPRKAAQFMFTLDTNRPAPALPDLFGDVLAPAIAQNPDLKRTVAAAMTAVYYGQGVDVTILVSKKGGRYRLQSGTFEALALIAEELAERLTQYFVPASGEEKKGEGVVVTPGAATAPPGGPNEPPFLISFVDLLPLLDYFVVIDKHFETRQRREALRKDLERAASQFRVIQKRLLVRFKDKNPTPIALLDTILKDTYDKIVDLGTEMEKIETALVVCSNSLACATQLLLLLTRFKFNLDAKNFEMLVCYLSPHVNDGLDQGWEECTYASMTHLLRTSLAKNARDSASTPQPLAVLPDTFKLKRHISLVCDRLTKGALLIKPLAAGKKEKGKKEGKEDAASPSASTSAAQPAAAAAAPRPNAASPTAAAGETPGAATATLSPPAVPVASGSGVAPPARAKKPVRATAAPSTAAIAE